MCSARGPGGTEWTQQTSWTRERVLPACICRGAAQAPSSGPSAVLTVADGLCAGPCLCPGPAPGWHRGKEALRPVLGASQGPDPWGRLPCASRGRQDPGAGRAELGGHLAQHLPPALQWLPAPSDTPPVACPEDTCWDLDWGGRDGLGESLVGSQMREPGGPARGLSSATENAFGKLPHQPAPQPLHL